MPAAKTVSWAKLRVGIMAIVAMVILGVLIFLLTGSSGLFTRTATLLTFMNDSAGMATGATVRLNGILIGTIENVSLSGEKDPQRFVRIEMTVRRELLAQIPEDSLAGISASNLLGDKFINIEKGKATVVVKDGAEIRSLVARDIPELMNQSANILGDFQKMVKRFDLLFADIEAGKGNLGKLIRDEELYNRMNSLADEAQKTIVAVRTGNGTLAKLLYDDSVYMEARATIKKINDMVDELQAGNGTAGKFLKDPAIYDEARKTLAEARKMLEEVNAGKGTVGMMLKDGQLYRQVNQTIAKVDQTLDKLNSGQGTLGQLLVNPQMYESLNGAMGEFQSLAKDIRANPKKFLRIKLGLF